MPQPCMRPRYGSASGFSSTSVTRSASRASSRCWVPGCYARIVAGSRTQSQTTVVRRQEYIVMKSSEISKEQGRCIHCLRLTEQVEADHVFSSSWYPDTTLTTVQRWTAPSCPECNRKLGQLEKDLLIRLALCIDPKSPAASGLADRVLRSLGLDADDLPEKEKAIRDKLKIQIRSEFIPYAEVAELPGKIPGLGP